MHKHNLKHKLQLSLKGYNPQGHEAKVHCHGSDGGLVDVQASLLAGSVVESHLVTNS